MAKLPIYGLRTASVPGAKGVRAATQLWTPTRLRKTRRCEDCKQSLPKRSIAYAPVTNALNRHTRLCCECIRYLAVIEQAGRLM